MESQGTHADDVGKGTRNLDKFIKRLVSFDPGGAPIKPATSPLDVIVYRVGSASGSVASQQSRQATADRKDLRLSKTSQGSRLSRLSSVFSSRGVATFIERTSFNCKEWLLLFIELLISFAWFVIRQRRKRSYDLLVKDLTDRMELMDVYFRRGLSSMGAMFAGYVADTYFGIYPVAVMNVVLHFLVSTILLLEEIIKRDDFDTYHELVWKTVGWSFIPLKATDFARMVFGIDYLGRKNIKAVIMFVFLSVWLNERSCGGMLILLIGIFEMSNRTSIQISFVVTGIASGLYLYTFRPDPNKITGISGIGNKVVGCIVTALWTKWKLHGKVRYKEWLELGLVSYERLYVTKTKQLLRLYIMIVPMVGFLFFVNSRSDFYVTIWHRMKPDGLFYYTGVFNGARMIGLLTMGLTTFVFLPLFQGMMGIKRNFLRRFVIGYLSALMCYFFAAFLLNKIEESQPSFQVGLVRFINPGHQPVHITSRDTGVLGFNNTVTSGGGIMVAIDVSEMTLFRINFKFGNVSNLTTLISVAPSTLVGYVTVEPPDVLRIPGEIPIWEGQAGYDPSKPRLYVSNLLQGINLTANFHYIQSDDDFTEPTQSEYAVFVHEGDSSNLQLPPGEYLISVSETEVVGDINIEVGKGGLYVVVLFPTVSNNKVAHQKIIDDCEITAYLTLGISIPYGFALTFAYVSLRAFLFANTPIGLEGLCFGFLDALESSTSFVVWIGFQTWHPFITSITISYYSVGLTLSFFVSLFILIKYEPHYKW